MGEKTVREYSCKDSFVYIAVSEDTGNLHARASAYRGDRRADVSHGLSLLTLVPKMRQIPENRT